MNERPENAAALVNGLLVLFLPLAFLILGGVFLALGMLSFVAESREPGRQANVISVVCVMPHWGCTRSRQDRASRASKRTCSPLRISRLSRLRQTFNGSRPRWSFSARRCLPSCATV